MRCRAPLVALAVAGVMGGTGCTSRTPPPVGATSAAHLYTMTGRVVALPDRPVRVCVSTVQAPESADITPCHYGIDAVGIDLARLQYRREAAGAVEGSATVTGRWNGMALVVERQADPLPAPPVPMYATPPCPAPPEGWPRVVENENLDRAAVSRFVAAHATTHAAVLRPSPQEALWLVTTTDVAAAEAELRPAYGTGLCIVRSAFSAQEYEAAEAAFPLGVGLGVVGRSNGSPDPDGQWRVVVDVVYLTDELVIRQRAQARDLVRLQPALRPV